MSKFEITSFVAPEKSNEWVDAVDALIEAGATDENAAITIHVEAKDEAKELRAFRAAAKTANKTVRIRVRDDSAVETVGRKDNGKAILKGEVALTLSLTEKYKDGRGRKPAAENGDKPEKASK